MNDINFVEICEASVITSEDTRPGKPIVYDMAKGSDKWVKIAGKTDTGADTSVGSLQHHGHANEFGTEQSHSRSGWLITTRR